VRWFVVIQHEVYGIRRRADKDNLEDGVVERCASGDIKGP
jgi:hypothetical protein